MQISSLSKIKYIFILSFFITSLVFSQVETNKTYYLNGKLESEGEYLNGKNMGNIKSSIIVVLHGRNGITCLERSKEYQLGILMMVQ